MKEKLMLYVPVVVMALIMKVFWLSVLVCGVTLIDIAFGVYLVFKLKEESFDWLRFFEGFLKMITYTIVIALCFLASEKIFNGSLFEINHLTPKIFTMIFLVLEATSIDKKRVRLGNKPILEVVRSSVRVVKEFYKHFSEIK